MKKQILLISSIFTMGILNAQVGINTDAPKTTLDVVATADKADGIMAPRLTGDELKDKDSLYGNEQTGAIVYATESVSGTPEGKTVNVTQEGYYYFDGAIWVKMGTGSTTAGGTEPWFVQNTIDEATDNTENIYQQGKVAVGFTEGDGVSDKQLDVKGDFRTLTEVGGRNVGIETNISGVGMTGIFNANTAGTETANFIVGQDIVASLVQTESSLTASLLSPTIVEYRAGDMNLTDKVSNVVVTEHSILLQNQDAGAVDNINRSTLQVGGVATNDIQFSYSDDSGNLTGRYIFPKTAGTVGQVLGVATSAANVSTLEWTDAAADVEEPWKIQNTTNSATANDDNIYQQGKVAIGFESTDTVSEKQFEVKGDVKAELQDDDNYVYGIYTATQSSLDPNTKENLMYVANNKDLSSATKSSYLGVNKNNVAFINLDKTDASNSKFNAILASTTGDGGLTSLASETSNGKYASLGGSTWTDTVEGIIQTRQSVDGDDIEMDLTVRPKSGITFKHSGATDYGSYTFPKNTPTEGQVLVGSSTVGGSTIGRQLEWKNISDLAGQPWRIQNTTTPASSNTENIYQNGKVAIGFDENDIVSDKNLDVKGNFRSKYTDPSTNLIYETSNYNTDIPGGPMSMMSISDNADFNVASKLSYFTVTPNITQFFIKNGNAYGMNLLNPGGTTQRAVSDNNFAEFWTSATGSDPYARMGASLNGNTESNITTTTTGIKFETKAASVTNSYKFPTNTGNRGNIMVITGGTTSSGSAVLEWKDLQDSVILKSPGGNCFKIAVNDAGVLSTTPTTCL